MKTILAGRISVSLGFLVVYVFVCTGATSSSYTTYYLEDGCSRTRTVRMDSTGPESSVIIKVGRSPGYSNSLNCHLEIKTPYETKKDDESSRESDDASKISARFGLVMTIDQLNLRTKDPNNFCMDYLTVNFKQDGKWYPRVYGCWGNLTGTSVASPALRGLSDIQVNFKSASYGLPATDGYTAELTVTTYAAQSATGCPPGWGGDTSSDWFECSVDQRCIWRGLTCDGRNNCGDDSDEWENDGAKCGINKRNAIIGVGASLAVLAVLGVLTIICCRRKKNQGLCGSSAPEPSAPLLSSVEDRPTRRTVADSSRARTNYGTNNETTDPPPYDYEPPYPPPPPYRE